MLEAAGFWLVKGAVDVTRFVDEPRENEVEYVPPAP